MVPFVDDLRRGLEACQIGKERLLVAVSGGADSVALLLGLHQLASQSSIELVVVHFNHQLRGADSDADAAWVVELAKALGLPCEVGVATDSTLTANSSALEETARKLRYRFFDDVATKLGCRTIALAHTANDQVETVLHHLFRGTGMAGLRGMLRVRQSEAGHQLVRPILHIPRVSVEVFLLDRGQTFRTDQTNIDTSLTRNRIRHVLLPMLRDQINPQVDAAICRLAEQAGEIDQFLREEANRLLDVCLRDVQPETCRLDVAELANRPKHLIRQTFRELWSRQGWPLQAMGFDQWNRLVTVLYTRETITLPDRIEVRFHTDRLLVLRRI